MNGNCGHFFKIFNDFPILHRCVIAVQLPILRKYVPMHKYYIPRVFYSFE